MTEPSDLQRAVGNIWATLPVGRGEDFNLILKELQHLRDMLDSRCEM